MMRTFAILIVVLLSSGCTRWKNSEPVSEFKFPKGRMAKDAVVLEIGIVQLDKSQTEKFEYFWRALDEQEIDLDDRKALDQNGIRVGIMASHAPAVLNELLEPRPIELEVLDVVEQQMAEKDLLERKPRLIVHQRINNRDGQAHPIQTSDIHRRASWIIRRGDLQMVGSGEYARGLFEVVTLPQGDGTVRLKVNPQIHHGEVRPTIGVADRSFFFDSSQAVTKLTDLKFVAELRPGESLMIAPTEDVTDAGAIFFGPAERTDEEAGKVNESLTHRMLMIRLVQTQMDNLFGETPDEDRLTSSSDRFSY